MARYDLSEAEWRIIEPLLPPGGRGPERVDDRQVINGIFYVLRTGRLGETCPSVTARTRRSTTASTAGRARAYGWPSSRRWRRVRHSRCI